MRAIEIWSLGGTHLLSTQQMDRSRSSYARIQEARQLFGLEDDPTGRHPRCRITKANLNAASDLPSTTIKQQFGPSRFHFYDRFVWTEFEHLPYGRIESDKRKQTPNLGITFG
jgi:hypothetical protein